MCGEQQLMMDGNLLHRLQKKALRLISSSNYIAYTEHICEKMFLLKLTGMFPVAVWKFYYKLMNDQLPIYFVDWKPVLPRVCTCYEIRSPAFHLPLIGTNMLKITSVLPK